MSYHKYRNVVFQKGLYMNDVPDLSRSFPFSVPDLKIKPDLESEAHGPHFDVIQGIPGGTDQFRVSPDGDIIDGTTNIGKTWADWQP